MNKRISLAVFMVILLCISLRGHASDREKLNLYLTLNESVPIGDFKENAKNAHLNLGAGIEYDFTTRGAIGAATQINNFEHKKIWYDSWNRVWRYTNWCMIAVELYGKYSFKIKRLSPYIKFGVAFYFVENKNYAFRNPDAKSQSEVSEIQETIVSPIPALGCQYQLKRFSFFIETSYNITSTKHLGGDKLTRQASQFVNFLLGMGVYLF